MYLSVVCTALTVFFLDFIVLAFMPRNDVYLIDFNGARQDRGGGRVHYPTSELLRHLLGIIFVDAQFMGNLAIAQIQPRHPHP